MSKQTKRMKKKRKNDRDKEEEKSGDEISFSSPLSNDFCSYPKLTKFGDDARRGPNEP